MDLSRTFTDALGRSWTVMLTMANDDRLEAVTGLSLVNLVPPIGVKKKGPDDGSELAPLMEFLADPYRVRDAVWNLVEPQAKAANLTKDDFRAGLDEEAAIRMGLALQAAIIAFFPNDPARQAVLRRIAKIGQQMMSRLAAKVETDLEKVNLDEIVKAMPAIDADALTAQTIARIKNSATDTPATSA